MDWLTTTVSEDTKVGAIITPSSGAERSVAYELVERDGWSLDVGATSTQSFLGVSKDIYETKKLEVDVGAGMTNKQQGYVGVHFRF